MKSPDPKKHMKWALTFKISMYLIGFTFFSETGMSEERAISHGEISFVELRIVSGTGASLQAVLPPLPHRLRKPDEYHQWNFSLMIRSGIPDLTVLHGTSAFKAIGNSFTLKLNLKTGQNVQRITTLSSSGETQDYNLVINVESHFQTPGLIELETKKSSLQPRIELGNQFLVIGPAFYQLNVKSEGTAVLNPVSAQSSFLGIRGIYRRRAFIGLTDLIPWTIRAFWDGSFNGGRTLSGESIAQGTPIWADSQFTVELPITRQSRIEAGIGMSYYSPRFKVSSVGDFKQYAGFFSSARASYSPFSWGSVFLGFNLGTTANFYAEGGSLTVIPTEGFAGLSFPTFQRHFLELRYRYYEISSSGTVVNTGKFVRKETYYGPEILWVFNF
jgi:hypothetical protein